MKEIIIISEYSNFSSTFLTEFNHLTFEECFRKVFSKMSDIFYSNFRISFVGVGKITDERFFEFEIRIDWSERLTEETLKKAGYNNLQEIFN